MRKRIISMFFSLALLLSMILPVYAQEEAVQEEIPAAHLRITTPDEFLAFAENCRLDSYSRNLEVSLETDIDLSNVHFAGVPIFSGVFEGNQHTISGLHITAEGSAQGLFRYLTATAVVQDLRVTGDIQPGGKRSGVGAIAGENEGVIRNCSFTGTVSGADNVGGLAGVNAVTGIIENGYVEGDIHGDHFVGGIAGENNGVIRRCINSSEINTTAQQNSVEIADITMDTLTNSEAVNTVTDIGGIAGFSSGVIRESKNHGNVGYQHMGYNIGGIAGTQAGYIVDCQNYANVQGRKEVGGIVGQMEPVTLIEYSDDTLQILQGQLGAMSGLVNQASGNAQTNAGQITGQIGVLQDQAQTARNAVETLFPSAENPTLPDADTILAAQSTLTSTITSMPGTLNSIASATEATVSGLSRDLQAISGQIGAMSETINSASENLGGSITDVSDQDTAETLTGKVENCTNYGAVLADLNAGGIAGAMAVENDLDTLEDWEQYGEESLNFESEVRAVILSCENQGIVTGKKQNVGGIVGWQSMGLVKNSENTGKLDGTDADYVGGISGLSTGFIRGAHVKCEISGDAYVGGIAGSATIVTDCLVMVQISDGSENLGAVLGDAEESDGEEEHPVSGNFYLRTSEDIGAVDGISYAGQAEPLALDAFMELENLPDLFRSVTVRFLFEDGTQKRTSVVSGGELTADQIPAIPEKEGFVGQWGDLAEADLSNMIFDMTFEVLYTAHNTTIQSEESRENGLPILLVQGAFTSDAGITLSQSEERPAISENETFIEAWELSFTETGAVTAGRYQIPEGYPAEELRLYVCDAESNWTAKEYAVDGSYLVFTLSGANTRVALTQVEMAQEIWYAVAAGIGVIALIAFLLVRKQHSRKKNKKPDENSNT